MRSCSGLLISLLLGTVHGFSRSSILLEQRASTYQSARGPRTLGLDENRTLRPRQSSVLMTTSTSTSFDDGEKESSKGPPSTPTVVASQMRFIYKLNASTKWLVTLAQTIAVWSQPRSYQGPYIVVGSILSVYLTDVLKKMIDQQRPDSAPSLVNDPGMPSSHSLVCFFLSSAWITVMTSKSSIVQPIATDLPVLAIVLWACAFLVALLRVICGYHTYAQVGVGAILGSLLGHYWSRLGLMLYQHNPKLTYIASFGSYLVGSMVFIWYNMRSWISKEGKHL